MIAPRILTAATLACALAPLPAAAQSQLDRMEALSEQANALMNEALVAQVPELAGNLPDPAWDDGLRGAYSCVLDGYLDATSPAAVDGMLDAMEAELATATADSLMSGELGQGVQMPEGMTEAQSQALVTSCGVIDIMMSRMAESGAMAIMMGQQ